MRLIDADLIQYDSMLSAKGNGMYEDVMVAYKSQINDLPTIERKTGKWIKRGSWYCCSECGAEMFFTGVYDEDQHYCYNCGSYNGGGEK